MLDYSHSSTCLPSSSRPSFEITHGRVYWVAHQISLSDGIKNGLLSRKVFPGGFLALFLALLFLTLWTVSAWSQESFITVDQQTGHIFSSKDKDERRAVASLTKIATGAVLLDAAEHNMLSMSEMVAIPAEAMRVGGINPAGLQMGDVVSLRDLLFSTLMASDNIAATAIAHYVGRKLPNPTRLDPVGNFVAHMNALARNLRMTRTIFLNPSGMDPQEGTLPVSTAADIARLTRYVYSDGDFRFYVSQTTRDIDVQRMGENFLVTLRNTNRLVGQEGIDGVKTGFNSRAGYCLVLSSWQNPEVIKHQTGVIQHQRRLITVVLGARTDDARFAEGLRLIRQGWALHQQWATQGRPVHKRDSL